MDTSRFIIFLDIDGVLWQYGDNERDIDGNHIFVLPAVIALNEIIKYYNADLCMISGWNSDFPDAEHYKKFLISRGIFVNNLYIGEQYNRYDYVINLVKQGLTKYLIIDDEAYGFYTATNVIEYKRILCPNRYRCLDKYDVKNVTINWKL